LQLKKLMMIFVLLFAISAFSQDLKPSDFIIDSSKPFVYLKFNHIGLVKPNPDSTAENYLWLKVINNCRLPIVFSSQGPLPGYPGVSIEDEVVEQEQGIQVISNLDMEDFDKHQELRKERLKHKPQGYSFEVSGVVHVQPGKEIIVSFPLNHVDDFWYLRIKFAFDLNRSSASLGPYIYLPFYKWDIPKSESTNKPQSTNQ